MNDNPPENPQAAHDYEVEAEELSKSAITKMRRWLEDWKKTDNPEFVAYKDVIEKVCVLEKDEQEGEIKADKGFIAHIQRHLKYGETVICKICGKTVHKILSEEQNHE